MKTLAHNPFLRIAHKSLACILAFCIVNMPVWALSGSDATVVTGATPNAGSPANTVSFDIAGKGIIDWSQMNVDIADAINTLQFTGTNGFAVLNRVATQANFNGILDAAGGHVFIVSPQGVIVGPNASITASAFTASGLNIANQDFIDGVYKFVPFNGGIVGDVTNYAVIDDVTDQVNFLGKTVLNDGTISLPEGGVVVMAAGDSVYLGAPGGKVIVEMTGIEDGIVTNAGTIDAPEGKVVLAAGDIYSIPLHPQLKINSGTVDVPVYDVDDQPVRVETGTGTVEQQGTIHADGITGNGGSVVMTAGDTVYLRSGSLTTANGGITTDGSISANGGSVIAYAYDFGTLAATTSFEDGARIEVKGGGYDTSLMLGDILQVDPMTTFNGGLAGINGNHIYFNGAIDAVATADPYRIEIENPLIPGQMLEVPRFPDGGTIQIDPVTLTIANGDIPAGGAAMDTFYEKQVENYSTLGVNLDLAADEQITVQYMADGKILGGSGDILLRNVYDTGGIYFESNATGQRTMLHTTAGFESGTGGNLYMIAGSGGIVAGDLKTDVLNADKISNPGRIRLLATNGGDIEVGSMIAERGNITEISAIAAGNLTVNGQVISDNRVIDKDDRIIGFARICLVAMEDVYVDAEGGSIKVAAHGKIASLGEIVICAGENVTIENLGRDGITASAQTSQNSPITTSLTDVVISAGANMDDPATISINGNVYDPDSGVLDLPVYLESKASGVGSSLKVDSSNNETQTSENTWYQEQTEDGDYDLKVSLMINNDQSIPMGDENSPCYRCPTPEGLPPVPHIFWILDDFVTTYNKTSQTLIDALTQMLNNDDNGSPLDGTVSQFTTALGGTLTPVYDNGEIIGFEYTPPVDAVYVVDENDQTIAFYTDTFTYKAKDAEGNESLNTATVTITVKNNVPVAQPDEYTESHNVTLEADGSPAGVIEGVVPAVNGDYDLDASDTLTAIKVGDPTYGSVVFNADGTFTYTPSASNTSGSDSFTYYVTDGYNDSETVTVTINLTNADPVAYDNSYGVAHNVELTVDGTDGTITGTLNGALADYDPDNNNANKVFDDTLTVTPLNGITTANGGTVTLNADGSFVYTPSADNTSGTDSFDYTLLDGVGGTDTATVTINLTNADPVAYDNSYGVAHNVELTVDGTDGTITGTLNGALADYDPDNNNANKVFDDTLTVTPLNGITTANGGTVTLNADGSFVYTPSADNTSGTDSFDYTLTDDFGGSDTASVNITLTNQAPIAQPDDYGTGSEQILIITSPLDVITGVVRADNGDTDPDNATEGRLFDDILSAYLPGGQSSGTTALGGTIVLNPDGSFTYTPPAGVEDEIDSFTYYVTDSYDNSNTVLVTIAIGGGGPEPTPEIPAVPLPLLEIPQLKGCPAVMDAAATELAVNSDELQLLIANSMATNPNLQPCDACENLLTAAAALKGINPEMMAAMNAIFNNLAPSDAPFTPEASASIQTAFANFREMEPQLASMSDEQYQQYQQYAMTDEVIEAFVSYVAVLDNDLKLPVGDGMALVMNKYFESLDTSGNPNISAYIIEQIQASQAAAEPIVASVD